MKTDLIELADDLEREAGYLEQRLLHFGWSDKREPDRADILASIGNGVATIMKSLERIVRTTQEASNAE